MEVSNQCHFSVDTGEKKKFLLINICGVQALGNELQTLLDYIHHVGQEPLKQHSVLENGMKNMFKGQKLEFTSEISISIV